jgi:tRNA U38,U39,U40 pseudouridine synthase TruA
MTAPASGLYLVSVDYGTNDEKDWRRGKKKVY